MKNQFNSKTGLCTLILLFSCDNPMENMHPEMLYGTVHVQFDVSLEIMETHARKMVNTDDFAVDFMTASGEIYKSYERYADMDQEVPLESGSYYVAVHSPGLPTVGFESPYYYGESDIFSIDYEESKTIQMEAFLANCMVSVVYDQAVIDQFADYYTVVSSEDGALSFSASETKMGYFTLKPLTIEATLTYIKMDSSEGMKVISGNITDPLSQHHYEIHVNTSLDSGAMTLMISVNDSVSTEIVEVGDTLPPPVEGPVGYGDLVISEVMYNPAALSDTEGEWFEIYNTSDEVIDIFQMVIKDGDEVKHIVSDHIFVDPQNYFVLAKNSNATIAAGYIYGGSLSLLNSGQELTLTNYGDNGSNGSVICSVDYSLTGFPDGNGASISLDPVSLEVEAAKEGVNWCLSTSVYETGDLGTPGLVNDSCL